MSPTPEQIEQFIAITNTDLETARFYLETANHNLDAAVSTFLDSTSHPGPSPHSQPQLQPQPSSQPSLQPPRQFIPSFIPQHQQQPGNPSASSSSQQRNPLGGGRRGGGFATLADLAANRDSGDEEGNGENDYYAGGKQSGQIIQGPPTVKPKDPAGGGSASAAPGGNHVMNDLLGKIFERAQQRGPLTEQERQEFDPANQKFTGTGYRLGDTAGGGGAGRAEAGIGAGGGSGPDQVTQGLRNVTRTLTRYRNGFTIDDGPLRPLDDPILQEMQMGFVPREMEVPGVRDVSIQLVSKDAQDYVAPKPKLVPFQGSGQRLGDTPSASSTAAPSGPPPVVNPASLKTTTGQPPNTSIQIRLHDGTRMVAKFNEDDTVADLKSFVAHSRPGLSTFTLSTTFPKKVLDNDFATVKEANLNGAVVVVTLK